MHATSRLEQPKSVEVGSEDQGVQRRISMKRFHMVSARDIVRHDIYKY